jgi:hypothetical protein
LGGFVRQDGNCLKKKENFLIVDDIAPVANCKSRARITLTYAVFDCGAIEPHLGFLGSGEVHSDTGDVIKGQYGVELAVFEKKWC